MGLSNGPAYLHFAITPSNTTDLPQPVRAIYFQTDGTVAIRDAQGTDITYTGVAGSWLPILTKRVLSTGTTATVVGWV